METTVVKITEEELRDIEEAAAKILAEEPDRAVRVSRRKAGAARPAEKRKPEEEDVVPPTYRWSPQRAKGRKAVKLWLPKKDGGEECKTKTVTPTTFHAAIDGLCAEYGVECSDSERTRLRTFIFGDAPFLAPALLPEGTHVPEELKSMPAAEVSAIILGGLTTHKARLVDPAYARLEEENRILREADAAREKRLMEMMEHMAARFRDEFTVIRKAEEERDARNLELLERMGLQYKKSMDRINATLAVARDIVKSAAVLDR